MNDNSNNLNIVAVYYADCDQGITSNENEDEVVPRWSTTRSLSQLKDEGGISILIEEIDNLKKKKKADYQFGGEVIEIKTEETSYRTIKVKAILEEMLELPDSKSGRNKLQILGDVLAKKYLVTPYSRNRLFILVQGLRGKKESPVIFGLVSDLTTSHNEKYIEPESHQFATQLINNRIGDLKKGMRYPLITDSKRNYSGLSIFEKNETTYYPQSLECIPKQSPQKEVGSFFRVIADTIRPTEKQTRTLFKSLRETGLSTIGRTDLVGILQEMNVEFDQQSLTDKWQKVFFSSEYQLTSAIFSQENVMITVLLDEFEIKCPLSYYPDRISLTKKGGYNHLDLQGRELRGIKMGNTIVHLTD